MSSEDYTGWEIWELEYEHAVLQEEINAMEEEKIRIEEAWQKKLEEKIPPYPWSEEEQQSGGPCVQKQ
jgi:hypothetical protein